MNLRVETVIRLRGVLSSDGYGDAGSADWSQEPDREPIGECSVQPLAGVEVIDGRDSVASRWTWFGPFDADVKSVDRLEHDGIVYDIDGSVQRWRDPTNSGLSHSVALLRRVDG